METRTRIGLSLKPDIDIVITELAKLTGKTKTSVINSILVDMKPSLILIVNALKKVDKDNPKSSLESLNNLVKQAGGQLNEAQLTLDGLESQINELK
jgi:uncharacterized protein (DUF1778 family)